MLPSQEGMPCLNLHMLFRWFLFNIQQHSEEASVLKFGYFWGNSLVRFCVITIVISLAFIVIHGIVSFTYEEVGCITDSECENVCILTKDECKILLPFEDPITVPDKYIVSYANTN